MEKSNMGQNTQSNQKHTWIKSAAIAPLPPSCAFLPLTIKESPKKFLFSFLSHVYISSLPKETLQIYWRKIPSFLPFLNLLSFLIFFPFYNRFPHRNNICAILLKNKISFFSKFCWFSFQINGGPFPHAQKPRNMI